MATNQGAALSGNVGGLRISAGFDSAGNAIQPSLSDASNPTPGTTATDLVILPGTGSVGAYLIVPSTGLTIRNNANDTTIWSISNTGAVVMVGNLSITGVLTVTPTQTVASAASAALKGLNVAAATITVTGTTQITAAQGVTSLGRPTITDASAVIIDTLATLYIANAPLAAGSVTLTATYALWVDAGTTRLDGDLSMTAGNLIFGAASAKIIPGATSLLFRDNGDANTNVSITDAGLVTVRAGVVITSAGLTVTAGGVIVTAGGVVSASPLAAGKIGYTTGAGGASSQATNKSTTVVAAPNPSLCGSITMNNANLAAGAIVSFTFTNTGIANTDVMILNHISGGTVGSYGLNAQCGAGSATINVRNNTAGDLAEAVVIQYAIIKAVNA